MFVLTIIILVYGMKMSVPRHDLIAQDSASTFNESFGYRIAFKYSEGRVRDFITACLLSHVVFCGAQSHLLIEVMLLGHICSPGYF